MAHKADFTNYLIEKTSKEPKKVTKKGIPVSHFTMLVIWLNNGRSWTYRGDQQLQIAQVAQHKFVSELEALLLIYEKLKDKMKEVKIYNNHSPQFSQLIFFETQSGTLVNNIHHELIQDLKSKQK